MQQDESLNHGQQLQQAPANLGALGDLQRRIAAHAQVIRERRAFIAQLQAQNNADQLAQDTLSAELAEAIGGLVVNIDVANGSVRSFASARLAAAGLTQP